MYAGQIRPKGYQFSVSVKEDIDQFFKNFYLYIFKFLATLGLRCCAWAFSSCSEQGLLFIAVCRLLTVVASLVAEHGLQ